MTALFDRPHRVPIWTSQQVRPPADLDATAELAAMPTATAFPTAFPGIDRDRVPTVLGATRGAAT